MGTRGRVITPEPIRVTPLPPLNEIDELHAPRPKGSKGRQPVRQPVVPNPATINSVQNDFIATTPFPPVKNVISNQQPSRLNRPFNLIHPFQTNFDQVRITPNTPQISQRPRQRVTTSAPAPPQTTTTTTTTTTAAPTTTTPEPTTTSDLRKQRIKLLNKARKTTTPRTSFQPTRKETERTVAAVPATTNRGRGRLISKTRVRRPINRNKSRRPQVVS